MFYTINSSSNEALLVLYRGGIWSPTLPNKRLHAMFYTINSSSNEALLVLCRGGTVRLKFSLNFHQDDV